MKVQSLSVDVVITAVEIVKSPAEQHINVLMTVVAIAIVRMYHPVLLKM
jgi:hypothetical protein